MCHQAYKQTCVLSKNCFYTHTCRMRLQIRSDYFCILHMRIERKISEKNKIYQTVRKHRQMCTINPLYEDNRYGRICKKWYVYQWSCVELCYGGWVRFGNSYIRFILHFYRNKWEYRIVKPFYLLIWNLLERAGDARVWERF